MHTSFCKFQTPSLCVNSSNVVRHLGKMRHSKPHMLKRRFGLSLLYTDTKLSSQLSVVTDLGKRFLMSQNTARPRLTSCFISLMRASLGQHFLLLQPTMFSLLGSGCSVRYLWIRSRASSAENLKYKTSPCKFCFVNTSNQLYSRSGWLCYLASFFNNYSSTFDRFHEGLL